MLEYYLRKSPLPGQKDRAEVNYYRHIDLDYLLDEVRREGGVLITSETETALRNVFRKVMDHVTDGNKVVLPWCQLYATIGGVTGDRDDRSASQDYEVRLQMKPRGDWKKRLQNCKLKKVSPPRPSGPNPYCVNYRHNKRTDLLLAGRVADIDGALLKIRGEQDPRQGIFFEPAGGGTSYRVSELYTNSPKLLRFLVPPDLPEGQYQIRVCTTVYANSRDIREGLLDETVEVIHG